MGYNKQYIKKALDEIVEKGNKARIIYEKQKAEILDKEPRLKEIEQQFMQLGSLLGVTALSGNAERLNALQTKFNALVKEQNELKAKTELKDYTPLCAKCSDTGYVGSNLCGCVLKRAKELSFAGLSAEMPIGESRFDNFSLDYYSGENKDAMEKIFASAKKYAENVSLKSESLLFFGETGLGKTHISLAIAAAALEKGMGVVYSPVQNLIQKLEKEHFSYNSDTPILDDVLECDLLILDDLGTEFSTAYSQSLIYNIINTRILTAKPTIISTNLTMEELANKYHDRVASRIIGSYNIKKFCGSDVRQQKKIEEYKRGKNDD
ncbi:MAG: ATP-binding protein, partial [Clostridia bacterium]|nr:ATP-binding protein [Clostridia bacterium]